MPSELNDNRPNVRQADGHLHVAGPPSLNDRMEEQVGGGRRAASPPPEQTPTRLRSKVKATEQDTGLVREAGSRRGRLLQDIPPGGDLGASANAERDEPSQGEHVGCASLLFTGVPSQSPYLTCKLRSSPGARPAPSASEPTPDGSGIATISPTTKTLRSSEAASTWTASHLLASTCAKDGGLPLPHVPPVPALSVLQDTLETVTETFRRDDTMSTPKPAPVGVENDLSEGDNDTTPRAEQAGELPTFLGCHEDDLNDITLDSEFHERPETPTPPSRSKSSSNDSMLVLTADAKNAVAGPSGLSRTPARVNVIMDKTEPTADIKNSVTGPSGLGRTPARVNAIMDEAFAEITIQFTQLANRVGLPFQQVINRFMKPYGRTCSGNHWNTYQKYHGTNKAQELARLTNVNPSWTSVQTMSRCYEAFQDTYPDTWQHILAVYEEADQSVEGGRSVGSRGSLFRRIANQYIKQFATLSKAHGIETAFVMGGSVVHQDGGNVKCYVSPGAINFWLERCRASENEIMAHFMAHTFNKQSMENVALAFDGLSEGSLTSAGAQVETLNAAAKHTDGAAGGVRAKAFKGAPKETDGDEVEIVEVNGEPEREDHSLIRSAFVQALLKVGCKWASSRKLFPWKGLPKKLASSGVVCHNFPDSVLFPGEERPRSKGGSKGISELSLTDCSVVIAAFNKPEKDRLYFEQKPKGIADLLANRIPVIIGASPEHDSPHPYGKRMFADGTVDRKGPVRVANVAATRIKRKNTAPRGKGNGKGVGHATSPKTMTLSESDEVDVEDVPAPPLEKRSLPLRKRRPTNIAVQSSLEAEGCDLGVVDISSGSGSEYEPEDGGKQKVASGEEEATISEGDPDSDVTTLPMVRKRKAVVDVSSRPSKKRAPVGALSTAADAGKGKAPVRPLKRSRVIASAESSEEGEFPTTFAAFKPRQPPTVNSARLAKNDCSTVTPTLAPSVSNDVRVVSTAPDAHNRPKPRLVTKESLAATQSDVEPFNMRRRSENAQRSTSEINGSGLPGESAEVFHGGVQVCQPTRLSPAVTTSDGAVMMAAPDAAVSLSLHATPADGQVAQHMHEDAVVPPSLPQMPADMWPPPVNPAPRGKDTDVLCIVPPVAPAIEPSAAAALPATPVDTAVKAPGNAMAPPQGNLHPGQATPHYGQEAGPALPHDRVPYPHGWYGPPGHGPQYHGYPGPYFGPYPGWGYPQMDGNGAHPSGFPGKDAMAPPPKQPAGPFDLGPFYYPGQPFAYPKGFHPPNGNALAGSSEGGDTVQGAATPVESK